MLIRTLSFFISLNLLIGSAVSCRFISSFFLKDDPTPTGMIVIFQSGEVGIERGGKKITSAPGLILKENDTIITSSGSVDIQTGSGDLIRIKSFSRITLKEISKSEKQNTNLYVQAGELLIKTNKLKSKDSFLLTTPTAVAGVRGTTFSFELSNGKPPKVKVYEGAVAITFKVPKEIIEKSKALDKELYHEFVEFLEKNEVVLENGEESYVKPNLDEMIQLVLTRMEQNESISKEFDQLKKIENPEFQKEEFSPSPQENAEVETMVTVDQGLVEKALIENPDSMQPAISSTSSEIEKDHGSKLDQALSKIESEAQASNLKDEAKIKEYYNILEVIVKTDGTKLSGAIVTQIGDRLILHSPSGVIRLNKNDIDYVDYQSFQIKTKKK
ncbi:FecR family protein [Leptospira stimsonii]|uniref:Transcriptional regulator n=1 Tax=Leptospira stimsonii TaxID=2202203 RepID=A0A4R9L8I8_9LEPT|nr:FecR family protein [Leptospira stimsonii]RHX87821.1 transcriptional regulator [Leptospira stimsonii]TGK11175.1 transcriptional regulator [Leptospira stimsonii]TGM19161.1 transcriptional regulator [Leptospira stimsonii]